MHALNEKELKTLGVQLLNTILQVIRITYNDAH